MTYPTVITSMPRSGLPPPHEVGFEDEQAVLVSPWPARGGAVQHRDRRPAGATAMGLTLSWLVERAAVAAFRAHHELYQHGEPFELEVDPDVGQERVTYAGPLTVAWQTNTSARVQVRVHRALPYPT